MDACLLIDPLWLTDRHSERWERIAVSDHRLTNLEQRGEAAEYDTMRETIVQPVTKARARYEPEGRSREAVQ